jgi:hypothetical protein
MMRRGGKNRKQLLVQYLVGAVVKKLEPYKGTLIHPTLIQRTLIEEIDQAAAKLRCLEPSGDTKKVA